MSNVGKFVVEVDQRLETVGDQIISFLIPENAETGEVWFFDTLGEARKEASLEVIRDKVWSWNNDGWDLRPEQLVATRVLKLVEV